MSYLAQLAQIRFRAVAVFQGFLAMRAPYQSLRLGAVAILPSALLNQGSGR